MFSRLTLLACALSAAIGLAVRAEQRPSAADIVTAAAAYVTAYQAQLTSVVADEQYLQNIDRQVPQDRSMPRSRRLESEMFFMFEPGGRDWLAIRDIVRVDGQPIADRPVLVDELQRVPPAQVVQSFKAYNARFNLGRIRRNFNEPTLGLMVLTDAHRRRFTFTLDSMQREGAIARVKFTETERPVLIRDPAFGDVLTTGEIIVETATGRVHRSLLTGTAGPGRFELETTYARDDRLDMWVPTRFRERYAVGVEPRSIESDSEYEEISGDARYSNYRRFTTSGRIKRKN